MKNDCPTPVLLNATMIAELVGKPVQTVHRWNTAAVKGAHLPPPDVHGGSVPFWFDTTVLDYAERRGLEVNWEVLERFRDSCQTTVLR